MQYILYTLKVNL